MRFESSKFVARLLSSSAVQLNVPHLMKVIIKDINRNVDPSVVELRIFVPNGRNAPTILVDWTPTTKDGEIYSLPVSISAAAAESASIEARIDNNGEYILLSDVMSINLK